jgi:uridine kinase
MKKAIFCSVATILAGVFTFVNAQTATSGANFEQTRGTVQANYDQLYRSLPQDLQTRIKSAAATIENIRMMSPQETGNYLATERERSDVFVKSTISGLMLSDEVKAQVDDARKEVCQQLNERMTELKARRAARK